MTRFARIVLTSLLASGSLSFVSCYQDANFASGDSGPITIDGGSDPEPGCQWIAPIPGENNWTRQVAVARTGGVYVTGVVQRPAVFGPGEANETTLNPLGTEAYPFLAAYSDSGELSWAVIVAETTSSSFGWGVAAHESTGVYVSGYFMGTAVFGPGEANETTLGEPGAYDAFIAKYSLSGELQWARSVASSSADIGTNMAILDDGSAVVSMALGGTAVFSEGEPDEVTLTCTSWDVFIARYASDGSLVWAKHTGLDTGGGGVANYAGDVDVAPNGEIVLTGMFSGTTAFGEGEAGETVVTIDEYANQMAVAWYDPATGDLLRARTTTDNPGTSLTTAYQLGVHDDSSVSVLGDLQGTTTFGAGELNETTLECASEDSCDFIARYDADGDLLEVSEILGGVLGSPFFFASGPGDTDVVLGMTGKGGVFDSGGDNETSFIVSGNSDGYLATFGPGGDFEAAAVLGGSGSLGNTGGVEHWKDGIYILAGDNAGELACDAVPRESVTDTGMFLMRVNL